MHKHKYIGWIPCVNGNLDFGLMKVGIKGGFTDKKISDERIIELNHSASGVSSKHDRLIVLQSRVNWRDTDEHEESLGAFRVFVTAKVSVSDHMDCRSLSGNILLYPKEAEPADKNEVHDVSVHQISHELTKSNISSEFDKLDSQINDPRSITGLHSDCFKASFKFNVTPTGLIRIEQNEGGDELDDESLYLLARQAFYYLKYSIHSHRHHVDEQDSLTTITLETSGCGLRLLGQLKRELTSLSRTQRIDNRLHESNNAKGIIGYAKSLVIALYRENLIDESERDREQKYLENVETSFESQEYTITRAEQKVETIKAKSKVWLGFALISIWGFTNFNFQRSPKVELAGNLSWFWPLLIVIFAFILYLATKEYYSRVSNAQFLVKLYDIRGSRILLKISLALVGMIALVWAWWTS
ncbi:hypothetical protein [Idiomarina baltica]|nr:hypothetical protein [Idiomarina baltica]